MLRVSGPSLSFSVRKALHLLTTRQIHLPSTGPYWGLLGVIFRTCGSRWSRNGKHFVWNKARLELNWEELSWYLCISQMTRSRLEIAPFPMWISISILEARISSSDHLPIIMYGSYLQSWQWTPRTPSMVSQSRTLVLCTPQAKRTLAILPHLDRTILTSSGVELAVWGETDAPDGTVMAFVYICNM